MNRRKIALALVLGVGGLSLAAHELLSFQIDARGAKGMAKAIITHAGTELGIDADLQKKATGLAEFGIDQAVPHLTQVYQNLSAIEKAQDDAKTVEARLADLNRELQAMVDVKDRVVAEAGKVLTPRERATAIVKVGERLHERFQPTPESTEAIISSLRSARRHHLKAYLKLDDARAKVLGDAMEKYATQRKDLRGQRREVFQKLKAALGSADDKVLAALMADWDKLTAKGSEIARAQLAEASKLLTTQEKVAMVVHAKQRIERALRIVSLIGKFNPVN
jgi:hypothetical protein